MHQIYNDIPVWGIPQENALEQIKNCDQDAVRSALMADHHLGYSQPIGGVVAYEHMVSPSGVGYDIACGNKAVLLDIPVDEVRKSIEKIMDDIWGGLSFGIGLANDEKVEYDLFDSKRARKMMDSIKPGLSQKAHAQLGTIGSGNHYVDLFIDEQDRIWCGVHFGSRGFGHAIASHFIKEGGGKDGIDAPPVLFDVDSDLGEQYLEYMEMAGQYAYAGRNWVCNKVAGILGADIIEEVHNHHNYAWMEEHDGEHLWVVRKGATPAWPGQRGFIGGSMGDNAVIVEGIESEENKLGLYSTVHGAGRVLSRTKARGKTKWVRLDRLSNDKDVRHLRERLTAKQHHMVADYEQGHIKDCKIEVSVRDGEVSLGMMRRWVEKMGVELRGAGPDESPHCYKRIVDVLEHHKESIKILHTLRPIGVAMAGNDEYDPYKD